MIVVAILGILMVVTLPAISSISQSSDLTRGGQMLADQVNLARQMASAQGTVVELRLIKLAGRDGYSAIQVWKSDSSGTNTRAARALATLPQGAAISGNLQLSAAFSALPTGTMPAGGTAGNAPYAAMQIRPSGIVTPVLSMSNLFFTVVPASLANNSQRPANYFALQINPLTGVPLVYRP